MFSPSRTRSPRRRTTISAVVPLPRPTVMPSSTCSAARRAAAHFCSSVLMPLFLNGGVLVRLPSLSADSGYSIRVGSDSGVGALSVEPKAAVDPLILSIDVGSSSARAIVYDGEGRSVRGWETHAPYAVKTASDGQVVADADELVELVGSCVDAVLWAVARSPRTVAAVAPDTFWHSLLGVDGDGKSASPILTWADTRSGEAARELRIRLDEGSIHARTGAVFHSSYWPAKLLWLDHTDLQPRSVRFWMSFAEYLYMKLFGERRVSVSMASGTGLLDQHSCTWDGELLEVLPVRGDQLSPIADFTDAMLGLQSPYRERWPALASVPWFLPLGDGAANNLGSGGFCNDVAVVMVGTSGAVRVVRKAEEFEVPPGLWTYRLDRRRIVQGGALSDGGNVFAWLGQTLHLDPESDLEKRLAAMAPDAHGLTVLPFLAGERSPYWRIEARAAFVGLTLNTKPIDLVRASLEAAAYRFGIVFDILRRVTPHPRGIVGSGAGLLRSPAWMQIMADVLAQPLSASAVPEATSRGAALFALEAMNVIADLAGLPIPVGATFRPQPARTEAYKRARARQEALYSLLIDSNWAES